MPARNSIKQYLDNGYYHLYNRGVEKRLLFLDDQDYAILQKYLQEYLLPKDEKSLREKIINPSLSYREKAQALKLLRLNNFAGEITLLAYCLMPNHFHFFVKQKSSLSIDKFMQSLCTRYTMYFNRKYKRVGSLFQGVYKAVLVTTEEQFLHLSRYIHKQVLALQGETLQGWEKPQPSSYPEYIGIRKTEWIKPEEVLNYFSTTNKNLSYSSFVAQKDDITIFQDIMLDN